jgi:hypothetical protein
MWNHKWVCKTCIERFAAAHELNFEVPTIGPLMPTCFACGSQDHDSDLVPVELAQELKRRFEMRED